MKTQTSATNRDADSVQRPATEGRPGRPSPAKRDRAGASANAEGIQRGKPSASKERTPSGEPERASPRVHLVAVPEDRDGQRLDNFLAGRLKGVPRSLIYRICRTGEVRVNGRRAKPDQRLVAGDEVRIPPVRTAEPADHGTPPSGQLVRIESAIIHEDREFLVIDKPAGVAQPRRAAGSVSVRSSCCARRARATRWNWRIGSIATPAASSS